MRQARLAAAQLLLFRAVLDGESGRALLSLLDLLQHQEHDHTAKILVAEAYGRLFTALAAVSTPLPGGKSPDAPDCASEVLIPLGEEDAWRAYIVARVLSDENPFTLAAQAGDPGAIPSSLREAASHDLRLLQQLASLDGEALAAAVARATGSTTTPAVWTHLRRAAPAEHGRAAMGPRALAGHLIACPDWGTCVDDLARHVARYGTGPLAGHSALSWVRGTLVPISSPDPVQPDDLIGYEEQRRALAHNTERFLDGLPANDILLFGSRGTGKSSSVKALLPAYAHRGLRVVDVSRHALDDLAAVCSSLRGRPGHYILFIDDLSFEEEETGYKDLKAVLEGRLEARPPNVRVYATSNRRHLVRERFGDRVRPGAESDAEVRAGDTAQEKLSLADRFGIVLVYTTPDQRSYLKIVEGIADRRGVTLPREELHARALRWAEWNNGRSGRTARQFVDSITGL